MTSQPDPKDGPPEQGRRATWLEGARIKFMAGKSLERMEIENLFHAYDDKCQALALRVVPPEGGPRPDAEKASETAAILMAMDAWRSTADGEKFDRDCPPIVYGIARSAYRMGLRAAERGVSAVPPKQEG